MRGVASREGRALVLVVHFHDAGDLARVRDDDGRADAVRGAVDGDLAAVRGIGGLVDIVHAAQRGRAGGGSARSGSFPPSAEGGRGADRRREQDLALGRDIGGLDDGPVERPEEAVAHGLRDVGEVHVEERAGAGVDARAQGGVGLVGGAGGGGGGQRPSMIGPTATPFTRSSNGRPAACSAAARAASAAPMLLGVPAVVKPPKPTVCPWRTMAAASAGERRG